VKIDLHHHLLHNRRNAVERAHRLWRERVAFKLWRWGMMGAGRFGLLGAIGRGALRALYALGLEGTILDPLHAWTKDRAAPPIPTASFRALWKEHDGAD
jgi:L-lactate dehydrogenase complex protein LldF